MSILLNLLLVIYVIVTLLMILIILMQRPKSEGLGAAFGGGMTDNLFGAQTTNVLTKITGWLAGTFFFLTFALSVLYAHRTGNGGALRQELMKTLPVTAPAAAVTPAATGESAMPSPTDNVPATTGSNDQPPTTGPGSSPTGADMAVGAVHPIPPPAQPAATAAASPAGTP